MQIGRIKPQSEVYVTLHCAEGDVDGEPIVVSSAVGPGHLIVDFPRLGKSVIFDTEQLVTLAHDIVTNA